MATGRTSSRWIRFAVTDKDGDPREIPVDSIGPVGLTYDEVELTAFQDAVKGYLSNHPDAPIDITGPFDTTAEAALAATGLAPTLSGSHTVLSVIDSVDRNPRGLWVAFGIRGYWAAGDPAFGVDHPTATNGYVCTKYVVEGEKYSASFKPYPGSTPEWDDEILVAYA